MGSCGSKPASTVAVHPAVTPDLDKDMMVAPKLLASREETEALARQAAAERATPGRVAVLTVLFLLGVWMTAEIFYEAVRIALSADGSYHAPSGLHTWLAGHTMKLTEQRCTREAPAHTFPLFQPMGECSFETEEYKGAPARSITVGHTVDEAPGSFMLWARMMTNAIHLFGALSLGWMAAGIFLMGGRFTAVTFPKELFVTTFTSTAWSMVLSGILLLSWRRDTEFANFATNISHPTEHHVGSEPGSVATVMHSIGRLAYQVAFVQGFATLVIQLRLRSAPKWFFASKFYVALTYVALAISVTAQAIMWPVIVAKLFMLPYHGYQWTQNVHLIVLSSMYPIQDAANVWALFWADFKGAPYDWAVHRDFNFSALVLDGGLTAIALTGIVSGPDWVWGTVTPVAFRICVYLPFFGLWVWLRGWPHLQVLMALPGAARQAAAAKREAAHRKRGAGSGALY